MQLFRESVDIPAEQVLEEREIPSDRALVTPLVVRLLRRIATESLVEDDALQKIQLCLDEALTNAVEHGNDSDFDKLVRVVLFRDAHSWGIVIRDEGDGFDLEDITTLTANPDEDLWKESGRGLALMSLYMDECNYYDGGSTLLLRRALPCDPH